MVDDQPQVRQNTGAGRFELADAPDSTFLEFRRDGSLLTLVHTQVDDDLEGRGIGSALVRAALDHAEHEGLTIRPDCPFARGWLDRHPDRAAELDIQRP